MRMTRTILIEQVATPDPMVLKVIETHVAQMQSQSPEESCHVMPADTLFREGATVYSAKIDGQVLGVGAFKPIEGTHGELKSMHTLAAARGRGVGRAMLARLMADAKARGLDRLSLETGSDDHFASARKIYEDAGFTYCPPFAGYKEDPFSVFMTCRL